MTYEIRLDFAATANIEAISDFLSQYSPEAAERTCELIKHAILGLREFPFRYAQAPESERASIEVRHVRAGNYRILY